MGVHRITSDAAKAYAAREKILGSGISTLGVAAENAATLDKGTAERCGDVAAELISHSPGYAGKLMLVTARLFWAIAGVDEKDTGVISLEDLEREIESLKKALE
jgi:hypothetical protein